MGKKLENNESVSINKFVSDTGVCSRREADRWIQQGRIYINNEIAVKGNRVHTGDQVSIDGSIVKKRVRPIYIKIHKPTGVTVTTDLKDKTNVIDYLNFNQRIFPVGRLDKDSTGLLLLTNDGNIVNQILRKENRHEKEYIVRVNKPITPEFIEKMSKPIPMLGTRTQSCTVKKLKNDVFKIILTQGLNRQIRRMCQYCGYKVLSLKRTRIMHIKLDTLKPGEWQYLSDAELQKLKLKT